MLKSLYSAVYNEGNIRNKHIKELLVSTSLLDFLSGELKESISDIRLKKNINKSLEILTDIRMRIYGWKKSEEK